MGKGDTHVKKHDKRKLNFNSDEVKIPDESNGELIGEIIGTLGSARFSVKLIGENKEVQATALGSFQKGPRKQFINVKDYVLIQPGISKNQYLINHLYSKIDIEKMYERGIIGKPVKSTILDNSDIEPKEEKPNEELNIEDIWDL